MVEEGMEQEEMEEVVEEMEETLEHRVLQDLKDRQVLYHKNISDLNLDH